MIAAQNPLIGRVRAGDGGDEEEPKERQGGNGCGPLKRNRRRPMEMITAASDETVCDNKNINLIKRYILIMDVMNRYF